MQYRYLLRISYLCTISLSFFFSVSIFFPSIFLSLYFLVAAAVVVVIVFAFVCAQAIFTSRPGPVVSSCRRC